jgi:hypothetical protein
MLRVFQIEKKRRPGNTLCCPAFSLVRHAWRDFLEVKVLSWP